MKPVRVLRYLLVVGVAFLVVAPARAHFHDKFLVYFPQVVKGALGSIQYETFIVVSNPGLDVADIVLTSSLTPVTPFQLQPGQTKRVELTGSEFQAGVVTLASTKPVVSAAHILSKSSVGSGQVLSQVTILGQPATSKAVLPVFRRPPGAPAGGLADNTGIAVFFRQEGPILFTLRDSSGAVVAVNVRFPSDFPGRHLARFVTELFPNLPPDFTEGSLTLEFGDFGIPRGFAVTALYLEKGTMWSVAVTSLDIPVIWSIRLKPTEGGNVKQNLEELAVQYGFTIVSFALGDPRIAIVLMTEEIARALVRNPRMEFVLPNTLL